MKNWLIRGAVIIAAVIAAGLGMRACARAEEEREKEALRQECLEIEARYAREDIERDTRILHLEFLQEWNKLVKLEKQTRGHDDAAWWKKIDERYARLREIGEDIEFAKRSNTHPYFVSIEDLRERVSKIRIVFNGYKAEFN